MAEYKARAGVTEMATDMVTIGGGFIVSGFSGRYAEEAIKPGVTPVSSTTDKVIAGVANNLPKLALYYLFSTVNLRGAAAAAIGSVGYDALIRLTNQGVNPANVKITLQGKDYRILNQPPRTEALPFWQHPRTAEEQRRYGAMPNFDRPLNWKQPAYGSLPFEQSDEKQVRQHAYGFAGKLPEQSVGKIYGML